VAYHQGLGRIIGGGNLLELEPEALQERDCRVEGIGGNPDCSALDFGVHGPCLERFEFLDHPGHRQKPVDLPPKNWTVSSLRISLR
jgi:hypothetical protein